MHACSRTYACTHGPGEKTNDLKMPNSGLVMVTNHVYACGLVHNMHMHTNTRVCTYRSPVHISKRMRICMHTQVGP